MRGRGLLLAVLLGMLLVGCGGGEPEEAITIVNPTEVGTNYELIVVGGEPEGIAAAVAAARGGVKTLLIADDPYLGGLMTMGELNFIDMAESRDGTILTQGIFMEFYNAVGGTAFDIAKAKNVFYEMVKNESNITLLVDTPYLRPVLDDQDLIGVRAMVGGKPVEFRAPYIIDGTADADVAAASGVPYTFAGEDIGEADRQMGVTLVFELSGVKWWQVFAYLNGQRLLAEIDDGRKADMGATHVSAWGYTKEGYSYVPKDPKMRLRGFNIARQSNGHVLLNALIVFDVDVLSESSKAEGIARAKKELTHIVPYLQENCIGFEHAALVGTAEQLYVRESRHIIGEYQLTIDDVLENRDQWDKIAIGSYPVDVQPTITQTYGTVIGVPDRYAIPYRSLVPLEVENLLVVGRSASYTSLAAGSARIIPIGMACGEGAGVAVAYAKEQNLTPRQLVGDQVAMMAIQERLRQQFAYLDDFTVTEPIMAHWAYPGVKKMRSLGLLDGGYDNNYRLDEVMSRWRYQNMVNGMLKKLALKQTPIEVNDNPPNRQIIGTLARAVAKASGESYPDDYAIYCEMLQGKGILTEELAPFFEEKEDQPLAAEVIMLLANAYDYLVSHSSLPRLAQGVAR